MLKVVTRFVAALATIAIPVTAGPAHTGTAANLRPASQSFEAVASGNETVWPSWRFTHTITTLTLFGVDVVDRNTIWASGSPDTTGVVMRTVDRGRSWRDITPPGAEDLNFHDVEAFDRDHAVVLAAGPGERSRIYRTADGGATWHLAFQNHEPTAFYDCLAFFDHQRGLAVSDPIDGKFRILLTNDGGSTWRVAPTSGMPLAMTDEGAHATGTCPVTAGSRDAWLGTSLPGPRSRVFHSRDGGRTWTVASAPIPGDPSFGIASLAFRDRRHGLAVGGGVFMTGTAGVVAATADGGKTWSQVGTPTGFRSGIAWVPANTGKAVVTVGSTGSDFSTDSGRTWRQFDKTNLRGVNCLRHVTCWAVGTNGVAGELMLTRN
jgi:photosystem II stability/assembly factor-like uncharacterized protein